ncbi:MAG: molybdopterin-dependent oxidoreductase [Deltaproteobacteria bacterium]|nr:molybdopterin-dependent oxidoreductase [Deltaproteobacteria bacterium]
MDRKEEKPSSALDRRCFLKVAGLLGAAAAGVPVVLRARDALADPDPPTTDPDVVFIHSTCQMCHSRCGLKAKLRRGQLLKIDGNPYHPNNRAEAERLPFTRTPESARREFGRLCPKGQAGIQVLYDPHRIQHPLKRVGPRGSGRWEVIPWAQAFREIAARINALIPFNERLTRDIDPASPDLGKIANQLVFSPGRSIEKALSERLFKAGYGTANYGIDHTSICEVSHHVGNELMTLDHVTGAQGPNHFKTDLDRAALMVVFGGNPLEANFPMLALARKTADLRDPARPGGAGRVVIIDPRFSNSAAKADQWVPVKPGGDLALALGMGRVILGAERYNAAFLGNANKAAATAAGEPCYTDATWLVIVEPGHRNEGRFLTPAEAGLTDIAHAANPVCVRASDGLPTEAAVAVPTGRTAAPVVGRLLPTDPGQAYVTVNGVRCRTAFALYRAAAFERTLDEYAAASGVDAATITQLAMDFTAQGRRASAWTYRGAVQHTHGTYTQLAVMALNWMVGNVDHAGGLTRGGGGWAEGNATGGVNTAAVTGAATPTGVRIDRAKAEYAPGRSYFAGYPAPRAWFPLASHGNFQELIPSIAQGYPYPIKALITFWNAWPYSVPGGKAVWERTVSDETLLPLLVSISPVLGEVAAWADYVLPDTTYLEKWAFPGQNAAIPIKETPFQQPVVGALDSVTIGGDGRWAFDPGATNEFGPILPDTKMHGDILIGLAKALSPTFPGVGRDALGPGLHLDRAWDFYRHQVANLARNVGTSATGSAVTVADIIARGGVFALPNTAYDPMNPALMNNKYANVLHFHVPKMATTTHSITGRRFRGVAHLDVVRHLDGRPVRDAAFPLQLVTYKHVFHGQARTHVSPWLMGLQPHNFIELSEPDARAAGVETGDRVRLTSASNPVGVVGVAKVTRGLRPGVVAVSHSYGHWENGARPHTVDGRAAGHDPSRGAGVTANPVMRLDDYSGDVSLQDPVGGSASFSDTWVRVEPLGLR